jgi:hypothetical protein
MWCDVDELVHSALNKIYEGLYKEVIVSMIALMASVKSAEVTLSVSPQASKSMQKILH